LTAKPWPHDHGMLFAKVDHQPDVELARRYRFDLSRLQRMARLIRGAPGKKRANPPSQKLYFKPNWI
jgi:hypothetical protein